jgi:hypothetical protein
MFYELYKKRVPKNRDSFFWNNVMIAESLLF